MFCLQKVLKTKLKLLPPVNRSMSEKILLIISSIGALPASAGDP